MLQISRHHTEDTVGARRPDKIIEDKVIKQYKVIDLAIPHDIKYDTKEVEKYKKSRFIHRTEETL